MKPILYKRNGYCIKTLIVLGMLLVINSNLLKAQNMEMQPTQNTVKPNEKHLFKIFKDKNPKETAMLSKAVFELTPKLNPQRLTRRMKILWGLDINDYPNDCIINLGGFREVGFLLFNPKGGVIWMKTYQDSPVLGDIIPASLPPDQYALLYRYIMMNDMNALSEYYKRYPVSYGDIGVEVDIINNAYCEAIFDPDMSYMTCRDRYLKFTLLPFSHYYYSTYFSNKRLDAVFLYVKRELEKGRKLYFNKPDEYRDLETTSNDIDLQLDPVYGSFSRHSSPILKFVSYGEEENNNPWYPILTGESVTAAWLAFQLRLNIDSINKMIIKDMYRKYTDSHSQKQMERLKKGLQNNNYYGHSILREFCENPMREMPTLEKIGTHFTAKAKEQNTLLLLEPFADSYDIDTVHPAETFKAYEMGHDDYYFVEIEKPVESPVADKDGYAMILDRTETVYGYILKSKVKEYTSQSVLAEEQYTDKTQSKRGVIQDRDGYVNVRKEANAKSDIVGKIEDKEIFHYWQTSDNWYIIETKDGLRGYVFKDRIREKYDTGGWTIDE